MPGIRLSRIYIFDISLSETRFLKLLAFIQILAGIPPVPVRSKNEDTEGLVFPYEFRSLLLAIQWKLTTSIT